VKLLFAGQFAEFYYLFPFAVWFASFDDQEILLSCWDQMIESCFRCFCEWFQQAPQDIRWRPDIEHSKSPFKYVAELPDLRRYLNSLLFLYQLLTTHDGALVPNRIGTPPVENVFGLIRMKCKWKHNYTAFLCAFSRSMIMTTI
jgi:hypothetical protein